MADKATVTAISLMVMAGAAVTGGYLDVQNNGTEEASTERSNPVLVAQYQEQLADLTELKASGQDFEQQSVDFLSNVYLNTQISEADVKTLTDEFSSKVAPPATLKGGYVLEHPEYLDEVRNETSARNLGALDQGTMAMHKESVDDGPWLGVLGGLAAYEVSVWTLKLLAMMFGAAGIGSGTSRRRRPSRYGFH